MKNIDKLRKEIDLIDNRILNLLKSRSKLALEIGRLKKVALDDTNLFRPERQVEILKRLFSKKNNLLREEDIFKFWREVFSHQTSLQGKLEFLAPNYLNTLEKEIILHSFGSDIHINFFEDINKAFFSTKRKNNMLLILPFPGKLKRSNWWLNRTFKHLFILASIPFISKAKSFPKLLVVSKHEPVLEGQLSFIYKSSCEQNNKNFNKIVKLKSNYLYISNILLKNKYLKLLGAYPNLDITNNNEKNK